MKMMYANFLWPRFHGHLIGAVFFFVFWGEVGLGFFFVRASQLNVSLSRDTHQPGWFYSVCLLWFMAEVLTKCTFCCSLEAKGCVALNLSRITDMQLRLRHNLEAIETLNQQVTTHTHTRSRLDISVGLFHQEWLITRLLTLSIWSKPNPNPNLPQS